MPAARKTRTRQQQQNNSSSALENKSLKAFLKKQETSTQQHAPKYIPSFAPQHDDEEQNEDSLEFSELGSTSYQDDNDDGMNDSVCSFASRNMNRDESQEEKQKRRERLGQMRAERDAERDARELVAQLELQNKALEEETSKYSALGGFLKTSKRQSIGPADRPASVTPKPKKKAFKKLLNGFSMSFSAMEDSSEKSDFNKMNMSEPTLPSLDESEELTVEAPPRSANSDVRRGRRNSHHAGRRTTRRTQRSQAKSHSPTTDATTKGTRHRSALRTSSRAHPRTRSPATMEVQW